MKFDQLQSVSENKVHLKFCLGIHTLPETNIFARENQGLEDESFPFRGKKTAYFQWQKWLLVSWIHNSFPTSNGNFVWKFHHDMLSTFVFRKNTQKKTGKTGRSLI